MRAPLTRDPRPRTRGVSACLRVRLPSSSPLAPALALALVVALALAPALASASWSVHGSTEPDTPWDVGAMYEERDVDPNPDVRKVYFNAVPSLASATSTNANVPQAGTRLVSPTPGWSAYLGVWKDCNDDGYIGAASGALADYRVEALRSTSICLAPSPHVIGGWVYEFLWLAHDGAMDYTRAQNMLHDPVAMVWGDDGFPGEARGRSCVVSPLPRGSTGSTGGLVGLLDCQGQRGVVGTVNALDEDGALGLRFDDPGRPQSSDSLLNQPLPLHPYYAPDNPEGRRTGSLQNGAGDPAFRVWACDAAPAASVRDPTAPPGGPGMLYHRRIGGRDYYTSDAQGNVATVPWPGPSVQDPHGSYAEAIATAQAGPGIGLNGGNPCRTPGAFADLSGFDTFVPGGVPRERTDGAADFSIPKRTNDHLFRFQHRAVITNLGYATWGPVVDAHPAELGVAPARHAAQWTGPRWTTEDPTEPGRSGSPYVDRATLELQGAHHATFYARVSRPDVQLPSGGGEYGAEWCADGTLAVVRGFDCDPTHWWSPAWGTPPPPYPQEEAPRHYVPGQRYHLRDVDCYDLSTAATPDPVMGGCA